MCSVWLEISSCDRNFLCWEHKIFPEKGMFFLWQEYSSCDCDITLLPVTQNLLFRHEIPYCYKNVLPVTVNVFLWLLFYSCLHFGRTQLNFIQQSPLTSSKSKILCDVPRFRACLQDARIPGEGLEKSSGTKDDCNVHHAGCPIVMLHSVTVGHHFLLANFKLMEIYCKLYKNIFKEEFQEYRARQISV